MDSTSNPGRVFKALWAALREHPAEVRRVLFGSLVINLGFVGIALSAAWVIDGPLAFADAPALWVILGGIAGVILTQGFFEWYKGRVQYFLDAATLVTTQVALFRRFIQAPYLEASAIPVGDLMLGVTGMREGYMLLTQQIAPVLVSVVSALVQTAALMVMSPVVGMVAVGAFALLFFVGGVMGRKMAQAQLDAATAEAESSLALTDLLAGVRTIKAAGLEVEAQGRWAAVFRRKLGLAARADRIQMVEALVSKLVLGAFTATCLVVGVGKAADGGMPFGSILTSLFLGTAILTEGEVLAKMRMAYLGLRPRLRFAEQLLDLEESTPEQVPPSIEEAGWIVAENVWFRYHPEGPWVVKGLNLRVAPGQKTRIEGASGFGKSTILRILAGLIPPERGQVFVGGRRPEQAKTDLLYLPQFPQLITGSIRRNLDLYSAGASWERIEAAARATGFDEIIAVLPMGYDTRLVEGGANLSGGQRQMLLLTACLATEKKILLLDEAMAALDWAHRAVIADSDLLREKTIIYASHDGAPSREA